MRIVQAHNVETWANTLDARSMLPGVVRRLVHATGKELRRVDFPAGEGVQRPGWDGVAIADGATAFVPEGVSLWEAGTGDDPKEKANGDFAKRLKDPLGFTAAECTFVFVTPRKWSGKAAWIEEKKKLGVWKDIRVYDSDSLEQWLETAPGVGAWFARYLGIRPPGIDDPENHWSGLSALAQPALLPGVFLASRSKEVDQLVQWLEGQSGELVIESRSPGEVVDFICACLANLDEARRAPLLSQVVLVETIEAWRDLAVSPTPLTLVAKPGLAVEPEAVAGAVRRGNRVILCVSEVAGAGGAAIHLPRVYRYDLAEALKQCGFGEVEADRAAHAAGGSCTVLKRQLTVFSGQSLPVWATADYARSAAAFLWIGAWSEGCAADREIVAEIGGKPYEEMLDDATALAKMVDPPLVRVLGTWQLASKDDTWMRLGKFVTEEQMKRFMQVATKVLTEDDPRFDLPADERLYAESRGQMPLYSKLLRQSVAETLALVSTLGTTVGLPENWHVGARVDAVVKAVIPKDANWKRWASISSWLPLLAEASPDGFLATVEQDVRSTQPQVVELLRDEGENTLFSRCNHAGLLWALETLAWSPEYLARVCNILVELDERDPGGKWGNRPGASVAGVLSAWHPQTTATVDQRIQVLEYVGPRHPKGAMRLLVALLPNSLGVATPTSRPHWRDWATTWSAGVTNADYWKQVEACARRAIMACGTDADRWCALLKHIENLPVSVHGELLAALKSLAGGSLNQEERRRVSELLREKVDVNREYADADWSLPADFTSGLDTIQRTLVPDDPVHRHAWLFEQWPERHSRTRVESFDAWREELDSRRRAALEEVLRDGGFDDVLRLCRAAESPRTVGAVLALAHGDEYLGWILPALVGQDEVALRELAAGFVWGRFRASGWEWVDGLHAEAWLPVQAAHLLVVLPFDRSAWDRAERFGAATAELYWDTVGAFNPELTAPDVEHAVGKLLERRRPDRTLDLLGMALHGKVPVSSDWIMRSLEHGLTLSGDEARRFLRQARDHGDSLFEELQARDDVDEGQLANLEFHYLALLDGYRGSPKTLHRMLSRDPKLFVELLCATFRGKNDPKEEKEATERERGLAMQAYRLMESWESLPGQRDDGTIDAEVLRTWVEEARRLAEEAERLEIGDSRIGHVLAHTPADADGTWPCAAVRAILESVCSEEIERGFQTGIYNARGVHSRGLRDGGKQERDLAEKYETFAAAYQITCPRTAAVLRRLAEGYRREARKEDEEAEWRE